MTLRELIIKILEAVKTEGILDSETKYSSAKKSDLN